MSQYDTQLLAAWCKGRWSSPPNFPLSSVVHDSRRMPPGALFVAYKGERFDGHSFIPAAIENGAAAALVDHSYQPAEDPGIPLLVVEDTAQALMDLARGYRQSSGALIVGVTGSVGKTSVKEMIADVLSTQGRTSRTRGNWNNDIGLPLSLLNMKPRSAYGVFEIGMNAPGELAVLSDILQPICGVITEIGAAHMEHFASESEIAEEKASLLRALPAEGVAVLDRDSRWYDYLASQTQARIVDFSFSREDVAYRAEAAWYNSMKIVVHERDSGLACDYTMPLPGAFIRQNALRAIIIGREFGLQPQQIADAIIQYESPEMRWETHVIQDITFINDAYNANPVSMKASFSAFEQMPCHGRKWMVLAGMRELGHFEVQGHHEVGAAAGAGPWEGVIVTGEKGPLLAQGMRDAVGDTPACHVIPDLEGATERLRSLVQPGDMVLIKGSRGERLERLLEQFTESEED
ncbi:MAG: UDP-N-acetylmuramoyl-tripeptide--D-alanyl-D-alanine ligase [Kiritimatiellia bacterium]|jgi:UDP-N-acetylmuramoyl-tripeptide--D-alanyl-D-alanine ligase